MNHSRVGWKFLAIWLACLLVCLALLIYPVYVIWPFRAQGARELAAALAVLRYRLIFMAAAVALSLVAAVRYWSLESRILRRAASAVGVLAVLGTFVLARINIYEMMFHHLDQPAFAPADQSKLDGREMVMAVKIGGAARAYPIRSMSYHHVVNDMLGGVPLAPTY